MQTRRAFIGTSLGTIGATTLLPFAAGAAGDAFPVEGGEITIHPVDHASFVMATPNALIFVDPVGDAAGYTPFGTPDLVLVTHHHGDHYKPETLAAIMGPETALVVNPEVMGQLPDELKARATQVANGESVEVKGQTIEAIPAYNITEDRLKYHPKGRDNGYILPIGGKRVYIAGDTEDIPEMRALADIHIAFIPMNLPYTMTVERAASAIAEFKPDYVYPYHYRDSDPMAFAALVAQSGAPTQVKQAAWYGGTPA